MQNKGAIKVIAIVFALICLYQLSFTYFTKQVESDAKEYATNQYAFILYLKSDTLFGIIQALGRIIS